MGFLSGALPLGRVWMDDVVAQFLAAALGAAPPRPPAAEPSPAAVQAKAAGAAAATSLRPGRRCVKAILAVPGASVLCQDTSGILACLFRVETCLGSQVFGVLPDGYSIFWRSHGMPLLSTCF